MLLNGEKILAMGNIVQGVGRGITVCCLIVSAIYCGAAAPLDAQTASGLVGLDGVPVDEAELSGDAVLVFFASWSPRCRDIVERAEKLERRWGDRARVMLVSFQEEPEAVRAFLAGAGSNVRTIRDIEGSFSKRHGITTLPSLLVLEGGSVAFRGRFPDDPDSVLRSIFD